MKNGRRSIVAQAPRNYVGNLNFFLSSYSHHVAPNSLDPQHLSPSHLPYACILTTISSTHSSLRSPFRLWAFWFTATNHLTSTHAPHHPMLITPAPIDMLSLLPLSSKLPTNSFFPTHHASNSAPESANARSARLHSAHSVSTLRAECRRRGSESVRK
jgi:hypothetical protein